MLRRSQKCHGLGEDLFIRCTPLLLERRGPREGSPGRGGRAGELGEARTLVELALSVYVPDRPELSAATIPVMAGGPLARLFWRLVDAVDYAGAVAHRGRRVRPRAEDPADEEREAHETAARGVPRGFLGQKLRVTHLGRISFDILDDLVKVFG
jgi:hypothetical protein